MNSRLTFRQYRMIDLTLFALILCAAETVIVKAATVWFPGQPYTVSAVGALTAIVLIRWDAFACIHAALGGLIFCYASGADSARYFIYAGGNLLSLLALLPLWTLGKERVRNDSFLSVLFGLCTLLLMQTGRAAAAMILGASARNCLGFFTTDALSLLFTGVIIWIARRLDGIFEDQKHYLLRIHQTENGKGVYDK